jgi:CubicO group peptidase (beta-lactamase class C family)
MYHVSGDVLGALIARVSGQSLGTFMRERIFDPLGMKDTSFHLPSEKIDRLSGFYFFNRQGNKLDFFDDVANSAWLAEPPFESGGGGLLSTIDDYFAFSRMMLNKGRHGREQILSRATVTLMTSDQVRPEQRADSELFFGTHSSWGLGMAVDIQRKDIFHTPGRFGWTGGFGTTAYTDPAERMIGVLFTQRMMDSPDPPEGLHRLLGSGVWSNGIVNSCNTWLANYVLRVGCEIDWRTFRIKNLFQTAMLGEVRERKVQLRSEGERRWGTMIPGQAVAHCSAGLETARGDRIPPLAFRNDEPMRPNSPTTKDLVAQDERAWEPNRNACAD